MTWHIHIEGQVQGVGFRPFVYSLAKKYGLAGWVNNNLDGVHLEINASAQSARAFLENILKNAPSLAKIDRSSIEQVEHRDYQEFEIRHSLDSGRANLLITPDLALCALCRAELHSADNPRFDYPFITCTHCGPRYSIIDRLPYDRPNTTMRQFSMCSACCTEYEAPLDRRYYAQTNSCPECAISLALFEGEKREEETTGKEILDRVVELWEQGSIVAVKGVGGFLLTCDAGNRPAIARLRQRKSRPSKPLALMLPDVSELKTKRRVHSMELDALQESAAPIVLINSACESFNSLPLDLIAPGLNQVGIMLPHAALFECLLHRFKKPIIATSGNLSGSPIMYGNQSALDGLVSIADFILINNRDILFSLDDSVVRYSSFLQKKIILRRGRGMAPTYFNAKLSLSKRCILGVGAVAKSTFCLAQNGNIYVSQYLGDLDRLDTQKEYQKTLNHFLELYPQRPEVILCDAHPGYFSAQHAQTMGQQNGIEVKLVQHHIAHFSAVLGENNLINSDQDILGVTWDGTGWGGDGHIWGGEFFVYSHFEFSRAAHFEYFEYIAGDRMARQPRISAFSLVHDLKNADNYLQQKFNATELQVYRQMVARKNTLKTSSVGRIFDAVASLLGLCNIQSYEGEAAMYLEAHAQEYFKIHGLDFPDSYFENLQSSDKIPTKKLFAGILNDLMAGKEGVYIAAKFHFSLIHLIDLVSQWKGLKHIAFSGGVFQNGLLVDLAVYHLNDYKLYFHEELAPNDENISFGQLVWAEIEYQRETIFHDKKQKICV